MHIMRLEQLCENVWKCNLEFPKDNLVKMTKNGMQL